MSNLREVNVLLKRIRELEAELASMEPTVIRDLLARAEKAEATLQEKIAVGIEWFQRMTNAEARVAELEAHANRFCECGLGVEHDTPSSWKYPGPWNGGVDSRPEGREAD